MKSVFQWFPERASNFAANVDWLFWTLVGISTFFSLLIFTLIIIFTIKYSHAKRTDRSGKISSNLKLEATWTLIPLAIVVFIFIWSSLVFMKMEITPKDATEIYVVGKQWMWKIQHLNGRREINELHVPVGKPIKLILVSQDVIHSFYIPAFRLKQDALPGRYTSLWFNATKEGNFHLFCTEFCGTGHSRMIGTVHVMSQEKYRQWLDSKSPEILSMAERGKRLYEEHGCKNCHDRKTNIDAPSLHALYGATVPLMGGGATEVNDDYIRESIYFPARKIHAGFGAIMPSYKNQLNEEEVLEIIAFMKFLSKRNFEETGP